MRRDAKSFRKGANSPSMSSVSILKPLESWRALTWLIASWMFLIFLLASNSVVVNLMFSLIVVKKGILFIKKMSPESDTFLFADRTLSGTFT